MRKIVNALVIVPLALVLLTFAVANRHFVRVSLDPFNAADPSLSLTLPLFIVIIAATMFGVAAGGIATWFGQRRWRREARRHEAEARAARQLLADLRGSSAVPLAPGPGVSGGRPLDSSLRLLSVGQDKPAATL